MKSYEAQHHFICQQYIFTYSTTKIEFEGIFDENFGKN